MTDNDEDAVSRAPVAPTFTMTDLQTAQTVTASAVGDEDAVNERVRLTGAEEYAGGTGVPAVTAPLDSNFTNTNTMLTHMVSGYRTATMEANARVSGWMWWI